MKDTVALTLAVTCASLALMAVLTVPASAGELWTADPRHRAAPVSAVKHRSAFPPPPVYRGYPRAPGPLPFPYWRPAPLPPATPMVEPAAVPAVSLPPTASSAGRTVETGEASDPVVSIAGMRFDPPVIRVRAGERVTWSQDGPMAHTVTGTSDDALLVSGLLQPGAVFSHSFERAGTYDYYCSLHPDMKGRVVVE